jgi:hypothetical protein
MKAIFRNTTAVLLALLVLTSTLSFTINQHFCGEHLVSTAVFLKAKSCGMDNPQTNDQKCETMVKNCCSEKVQLIVGQEDLKLDLTEFQQHHLIFNSTVLVYIDLFEGLDKHIIPNKHYRPPRVVRDIQLLDEVFLI